MLKSRIRRWTWTTAALFAIVSFIWITAVMRESLTAALIGAVIAGCIPLFIGAWMLFSPSASAKSPLRYMGFRPPTIIHSDEPESEQVIRRPRKKPGRR